MANRKERRAKAKKTAKTQKNQKTEASKVNENVEVNKDNDVIFKLLDAKIEIPIQKTVTAE